ncbi:D-alanyl-D-alanine carboxypeptidase [Alicyclobacillus fastidiosus]|uniref:serine-type D-Ala-D-Ala carboxypeptidase n=1 Tax=Alicyclobacillus fastidiosus TaxID=392011 RepID=A0ABY6ZG32_9BACL|nr:D-alanyl-D-alanine carboxypeptidase family protein [Alicyclobacillus fastidiosus]WAH41538.1 D-alanyl-D-alanine carboxypeptidase [Alicyclobacillus fastidiosus]
MKWVGRAGGKRLFQLMGVLVTSAALLVASPSNAMAASKAPVLDESILGGVPYVSGVDSKSWPSIVSQAAVVMDMNTGAIVYAKNPLAEHYPASITKIMTALLALKYGKLSDRLTASKNAVNQPPDKLYMVPGEVEELEPLLYGLLLDSANDAAVDIAEHYGGSVSKFATMMNDEAKSLGATHTHFDNPNGLPDPKHQTTAYDMAVIARAAMQYPEFRKIVQTKYYDWKGKAWQSKLENLNTMLFYYPGCIGLKTGFTSVAHETLVVAAKRGTDTFLAVLMDNPTDYSIRHDASQLLDYAFAHYETWTIVRKGQTVAELAGPKGTSVAVQATETVTATVPKDDAPQYHDSIEYAFLGHPMAKGSVIGTLEVEGANGKVLASVPAQVGADLDPIEAIRVEYTLFPLAVLLSLLFVALGWIWVRRRNG